MSLRWASAIAAALGIAVWTASAAAALTPHYPTANGPVVDDARLLSEGTRSMLADQLARDNQTPTAQLAVATVQTTGGLSIEDYALELFNRWGVGHRDDNDGVLLLVAAEDHKVRIQTGRGLGERMSDQRAKQIVDDHIVPRFQRGDYADGVVAGVEAIRRQLGFGPGLNLSSQDGDGESVVAGLGFVGALAAVTGGVILFARRAARRNEERGGWYTAAIGGPDGSSSGGGGGFGGGDSGGGGASGGW